MLKLQNRPQRYRTLIGFILLLALSLATQTWAFPELIRHGYVNCTTCHASPNGGGLLTPYGRALAGEVLSTWSKEKESRFLYVVDPPDWLELGGDVRAAQLLINSPASWMGQFIWMQKDVEAGVSVGPVQVVATLGHQTISTPHPWTDEILSRRHFVLVKATDKWSFRAGRFGAAYGINFADHSSLIRSGLGFDQGTETYNVEASWIGEVNDVFVTALMGRPGSATLDTGFALRSSIAFDNKHKLGFSYLYGQNATRSRHLFGPYAVLGIAPNLFALFESDMQSISGSGSRFGFATYFRLDYEILQGLHIFLLQQFARFDFATPDIFKDRYGVGVQFFPRPHWEFYVTYEKQRDTSTSPDFSDVGLFLIHFYL